MANLRGIKIEILAFLNYQKVWKWQNLLTKSFPQWLFCHFTSWQQISKPNRAIFGKFGLPTSLEFFDWWFHAFSTDFQAKRSFCRSFTGNVACQPLWSLLMDDFTKWSCFCRIFTGNFGLGLRQKSTFSFQHHSDCSFAAKTHARRPACWVNRAPLKRS